MDLNKRLKELKPQHLNCNVFDVYSYNGLTMQDLLCQFFTKINECVTSTNEVLDLTEWLVSVGLEEEVVKKLMGLIKDGTIEKLINVNLFNSLTSQLEHKANKNEVFSMANMGQDVKEAMTGGSVSVVGKNSVLGLNVVKSQIGLRELDDLFKEETTNKAYVLYGECSNDDIKVFVNGQNVTLNGTTTSGCEIKIYLEQVYLDIDSYYLIMSNQIPFIFDGVLKNMDGEDIGAHAYNSNVFGINSFKQQIVNYLSLTIPSGTLNNFTFNLNLVKQSQYKNGVREEPYVSKLVNIEKLNEEIEKINNRVNSFKGKKWVTIGDSITYGFYLISDGQGGRYQWQEKVAEHFDMEFINLGISGSTTAGFMREEVKNNIPSDVDIITVMGGTNDYGQNVNINDVDGYEFSGGTYPGAIRDLIRYLTTNFPNAKILFCNCVGGGASQDGITLYEKNVQGKTYHDYAKKCIETANEMNIPCIDLFGECGINLYNRNKFISDTVHPTIEGYNRIANVYIDNFYKYEKYLCN